MWSVGAGVTVLAVLAVLASTIPWDGFWRGAGQPYATTLAALAAISAAAIALHNSRTQLEELREQRKQDQTRYEEQRDRDQKRYEEQRDQDQDRWFDQRRRDDIRELRRRFAEATQQLADDRPTVRRSGVYSMMALVQDWRDLGQAAEARVCLGVLGAYVATPNPTYSEEQGVHRPEAGSDGPIRALIVSVFCEDGAPECVGEFDSCNLLEYADLRAVEFLGITFNNVMSLSGAKLNGADFIGATLPDRMDFSYAKLDYAWLPSVNLRHADFGGASLRSAHFDRAQLHDADFRFSMLDETSFEEVTYNKGTSWPDGFSPPETAVLSTKV